MYEVTPGQFPAGFPSERTQNLERMAIGRALVQGGPRGRSPVMVNSVRGFPAPPNQVDRGELGILIETRD